MATDDLRVTKLRDYLMGVVTEIATTYKEMNVNFLSDDVESYSLDKIPVIREVETWVIGTILSRDVYSFRSRMNYSADTISNIENIGFYELFEKTIKDKNDKNELPDIKGIQSISCLNCGTQVNATTHTAEFDIQIQIVYIDNLKENHIYL